MAKPQLILVLLLFSFVLSVKAQDTTITTYWENGSIKTEWKGTKEKIEFDRIFGGIDDGITKEWYENGQLRSIIAYHKGKKHGTWEAWHSNGKKWVEQRFEMDQPVGSWQIWNEKGNEMAKVTFYNGMPAKGTWLIYFPEIKGYHKIKVLKDNRSQITGLDKNNKKFKRTSNNIDLRWWEYSWY